MGKKVKNIEERSQKIRTLLDKLEKKISRDEQEKNKVQSTAKRR